MEKEALYGKTLTELEHVASSLAMPSFTAKQIADWFYKKDISSIDEMTNISKENRDLLSEKYQTGRDGSCKSSGIG